MDHPSSISHTSKGERRTAKGYGMASYGRPWTCHGQLPALLLTVIADDGASPVGGPFALRRPNAGLDPTDVVART